MNPRIKLGFIKLGILGCGVLSIIIGVIFLYTPITGMISARNKGVNILGIFYLVILLPIIFLLSIEYIKNTIETIKQLKERKNED